MSVNWMYNILRHCFVLLFVILTVVLHAQQLRYQFKNYTPSDGLPSSETYQVLRDASNYMWFATDHGVTRYNGYEFETFNLPDNSIMGLYEDGKKRIWAFTFSGRLFYYQGGQFHDYKWNNKLTAAVKSGIIHAIYIDSSERLHAVLTSPNNVTITEDGVLEMKIDETLGAKYEVIETKRPNFFVRVVAFPVRRQLEIKYDAKSEISITSGPTKIKLTIPYLIAHERCRAKQLSDGRLILYSLDCYVIIRSASEYSLVKTPYSIDDVEEVEEELFLATRDGLHILNKKGEITEKYLEGIHVTSIEKDYEGGLWFTTITNGVYYLNYFKIRHLAVEEKVIDKRINLLYRLSDSSILASVQGNEMMKFKPKLFLGNINLKVKDIQAFYEINPSFILVGGRLGWFHPNWRKQYSTNKADKSIFFQIPNNSNFIVKDSILYSGLIHGIYEYKLGDFKYPYGTSISNFRTAKLFPENGGAILVGNHLGLWRYHAGKITPYDSTKKILSSRITDIAYYNNKYLCLSTRGNGLLFLLKDSIYQVSHANGLISDNIRKVYVDNDNIWLATNKGISIVTIKSLQPFRYTIRSITVQDGLLSNEINSIISDGHDLVVASNNGISFLNSDAVMQKKAAALPFYIKEIKINSLPINVDALTNLDYRKRSLNIAYEALNYSSNGRNNYRYRLLGYDSTWIYTNNREVQFNPLPYGSYKLHIQAKRGYDQWNNTGSNIILPVVCLPPFWSTTWFWALSFMLALFAVFLFFRNRIKVIRKRQKEKEKLQQRIGESEQMALRAQMNPHFIFNSLNSIQQYVIESDVEGSNEFITGFSRLIRQTLEFSSKEQITLEEEISYLTTYLKLEKARMESKFVHEVDIQTNQPVSELELPPLLLQPYVENALRHGIRYLKDVDGLIRLAFYERAGVLECIIEDNGIGRVKAMELKAANPIEYQSRGMSLTAERIALLNEGKERKIEVVIEDMKDKDGNATGTRVRLIFPG